MVLVYPMFAMVVLTLAVGLITVHARVQAVRKEGLDVRYFKTYSGGQPSDHVVKTGRHFSNLFEVPVLFYAGCLTAIVTATDGLWPCVFAWAFVGSRVVHAYIHIGSNHVLRRMAAFFAGLFAVTGLWICIVFKIG